MTLADDDSGSDIGHLRCIFDCGPAAYARMLTLSCFTTLRCSSTPSTRSWRLAIVIKLSFQVLGYVCARTFIASTASNLALLRCCLHTQPGATIRGCARPAPCGRSRYTFLAPILETHLRNTATSSASGRSHPVPMGKRLRSAKNATMKKSAG